MLPPVLNHGKVSADHDLRNGAGDRRWLMVVEDQGADYSGEAVNPRFLSLFEIALGYGRRYQATHRIFAVHDQFPCTWTCRLRPGSNSGWKAPAIASWMGSRQRNAVLLSRREWKDG